jgi:hypothetical protein
MQKIMATNSISAPCHLIAYGWNGCADNKIRNIKFFPFRIQHIKVNSMEQLVMKLTVAQQVEKSVTWYGTRRFIIVIRPTYHSTEFHPDDTIHVLTKKSYPR